MACRCVPPGMLATSPAPAVVAAPGAAFVTDATGAAQPLPGVTVLAERDAFPWWLLALLAGLLILAALRRERRR